MNTHIASQKVSQKAVKSKHKLVVGLATLATLFTFAATSVNWSDLASFIVSIMISAIHECAQCSQTFN